MPFGTIFGSRNWDAENGQWDQSLGEILGAQRKWVNGFRPPFVCEDGKPVGDPSIWVTGAPYKSIPGCCSILLESGDHLLTEDAGYVLLQRCAGESLILQEDGSPIVSEVDEDYLLTQ